MAARLRRLGLPLVLCVLIFGALTLLAAINERGSGDARRPSADPTARENVIARGRAPAGGAWWIATYTSDERRSPDGRVEEPAGLPCIRLALLRAPAGTPFRADAYCGEQGRRGLTVSELAILDRKRKTKEIILWGEAPEGAARVEIRAAEGRRFRARIFEAPKHSRGDVWVLPASPGLRAARVTLVGRDGRSRASLDASASFDVGPAPD